MTSKEELRLTKINKDKESHKDTKIERLIDEKTKRPKNRKKERQKNRKGGGHGGARRVVVGHQVILF